MLRRFFVFLALFSLLLFAVSADDGEGRLVVRFKPGAIIPARGLRAASAAAASVRKIDAKYAVIGYDQQYKKALEVRPDWKHLENYYIIRIPKSKNLRSAADDFRRDPNVLRADQDTMVKAFDVTPNDPYFSSQWGLTKISAPSGWIKSTGSADLTVAVIDSGIALTHEDFANKIDTANAWNFVSGNSNVADDNGHGTAISGVIGAVGNNAKGVAGMDWKCKILPMKVLNHSGDGSMSDVNAALALLAAKKSAGVNIAAINMSLGQTVPGADTEQRCQEAYDQGIVLVAAAGNEDTSTPTYPAYYSTVIAVAATDAQDVRSDWGLDPDTHLPQKSNYGTWVDISAPGTSIYSTNINGSYSGGGNGTSLAAPFVTGTAALIRGANPQMTQKGIVSQILSNTDSIDAQNPNFIGKLGSGRLNLFKALYGSGLVSVISKPKAGDCIKGRFEITGEAAGYAFGMYTLEAVSSSDVITTIESSSISVESGTLGFWDTVGINGNYTLRLRVYSTGLATLDALAAVTVDNVAPEAGITYPLDGATIEGKITVKGTAKDALLDYYALEYGEGASPANYYNIGTYYASVEGADLGTWETTGLNGDYTLRLRVLDRAGNELSSAVRIGIVGSTTPTKEIVPVAGMQAIALPNPFDRMTASSTVFYYNLQGNFDAELYLFDISGNLVLRRHYTAGENGAKSGINTPSWDGKNGFGKKVDSGVYIYQIAADQKIIARGKVIVLN